LPTFVSETACDKAAAFGAGSICERAVAIDTSGLMVSGLELADAGDTLGSGHYVGIGCTDACNGWVRLLRFGRTHWGVAESIAELLARFSCASRFAGLPAFASETAYDKAVASGALSPCERVVAMDSRGRIASASGIECADACNWSVRWLRSGRALWGAVESNAELLVRYSRALRLAGLPAFTSETACDKAAASGAVSTYERAVAIDTRGYELADAGDTWGSGRYVGMTSADACNASVRLLRSGRTRWGVAESIAELLVRYSRALRLAGLPAFTSETACDKAAAFGAVSTYARAVAIDTSCYEWADAGDPWGSGRYVGTACADACNASVRLLRSGRTRRGVAESIVELLVRSSRALRLAGLPAFTSETACDKAILLVLIRPANE
jgi:hypothetical protein